MRKDRRTTLAEHVIYGGIGGKVFRGEIGGKEVFYTPVELHAYAKERGKPSLSPLIEYMGVFILPDFQEGNNPQERDWRSPLIRPLGLISGDEEIPFMDHEEDFYVRNLTERDIEVVEAPEFPKRRQ